MRESRGGYVPEEFKAPNEAEDRSFPERGKERLKELWARRRELAFKVYYNTVTGLYESREKVLPGENVLGYAVEGIRGVNPVSQRELGPSERTLNVLIALANATAYGARASGKEMLYWSSYAASWGFGGATFAAEKLDGHFAQWVAQARETARELDPKYRGFLERVITLGGQSPHIKEVLASFAIRAQEERPQ